MVALFVSIELWYGFCLLHISCRLLVNRSFPSHNGINTLHMKPASKFSQSSTSFGQSLFKNVYRIAYPDGTIGMHHATVGAAYLEADQLRQLGITVQAVQVRMLELEVQPEV